MGHRRFCFVACPKWKPCHCREFKEYTGDSVTEQQIKMEITRAKLKCYEIAEFQGWTTQHHKDENGKWVSGYAPAKKIKMQIVSGGSDENDHFQAVSRGTNFELITVNSNVWPMFQVGGEYYCDFTKANN